MICRPWRDLILLDVDGKLSEADRGRLQAHLGECPDCRQYAREARGILAVLPEQAFPDVPPGLERGLLGVASHEGRRVRVRRRLRYWPAAAAAALIVGAALFIFLPRRAAESPPPREIHRAEDIEFAGDEIDLTLASVADAVERQVRPIKPARLTLALRVTTQPAGSPPVYILVAVAPLRLDDELDLIGLQIEALDQPIFEEVHVNEGENGC